MCTVCAVRRLHGNFICTVLYVCSASNAQGGRNLSFSSSARSHAFSSSTQSLRTALRNLCLLRAVYLWMRAESHVDALYNTYNTCESTRRHAHIQCHWDTVKSSEAGMASKCVFIQSLGAETIGRPLLEDALRGGE